MFSEVEKNTMKVVGEVRLLAIVLSKKPMQSCMARWSMVWYGQVMYGRVLSGLVRYGKV